MITSEPDMVSVILLATRESSEPVSTRSPCAGAFEWVTVGVPLPASKMDNPQNDFVGKYWMDSLSCSLIVELMRLLVKKILMSW